ncbi:winged helix-turn-helix domain-containing protein [Halospeciosus flavus]|uniref:Helix-turn-helix domain-containing protein n=1 Tax=Halospeciosus flavus TaxID=3032283 RepID=A0ABD5Z596_9EURY|nr:helix-turn-helix domain-containing protein [Halospeciosus flavus]
MHDRDAAPDLQTVLDALDDADCRDFVQALEEPMTAGELSEACDVPRSTTYRKLDLLTDASLVEEVTEVRADGHHRSRYRVAFEEIRMRRDEDGELVVRIRRPEPEERGPEERLADIWSEVRRET